MKAKRKRHSAAFKAKVGFEALVGLKTVSQRQAPLVSNTDQGSQFTSPMFIDAVESAGVDVSMDEERP